MKVVSGFSIIELMVVLAIAGILTAVAIPTYKNYKDRAILNSVQPYLDKALTVSKAFYSLNGRFPQTPYEARGYLDSPTDTVNDPYISTVTFYGPCNESTVSRFAITFKDGLNIGGLTTSNWSFVYHLTEDNGAFEYSCRKNSYMQNLTIPTQCDAGVTATCTATSPYNTYDSSVGAPP